MVTFKSFKEETNDKDMMLLATDIIRTTAEHQTGLKRIIGRILNKLNFMYYGVIK